MNIYLIGMPLCGKTTVGKIVSEKLNMNFIDLDFYIKTREKMSIKSIFSKHGEEYFRKKETASLKQVRLNYANTIISCGGGIVLKEENLKLLDGLVIYLYCDLNTLEKRVNNDDTRPLLKNLSLSQIYDLRKDKYLEASQYIIKNNDLNITIDEVIRIIKNYEKNTNS